MNITKELYRHFIGDNFSNAEPKRSEELKDWYAGYKETRAWVDSMRDSLADGYELDSNRDIKFLNEIIFEHDNWISAGGHHQSSELSEKVFQKLINTELFLKKLSRMIQCPNFENFEAFGNSWRSNGGGDFRHRINRTFAACTYDVSSTTSAKRFVFAFDLFNRYKLITPYTSPVTDFEIMYECQWYKENTHLMTELCRIFQAELNDDKNDDVDLAKLSMFVWEIYANRKEVPALVSQYSV